MYLFSSLHFVCLETGFGAMESLCLLVSIWFKGKKTTMMHTLQMRKMFNGVWWLHIELGVPLIRLAVLHNGSAQPIVDRAFTLFVSISLESVIRKVEYCPIRLPRQSWENRWGNSLMCQYLSFGPDCPQRGLVECPELSAWLVCVLLIASAIVNAPQPLPTG